MGIYWEIWFFEIATPVCALVRNDNIDFQTERQIGIVVITFNKQRTESWLPQRGNVIQLSQCHLD